MTYYQAKVSYKFDVAGKSFWGSRISYGDQESTSSSHADALEKKYNPGKEVTVYYMPDNPKESLLEPGMQTDAFFPPIIGAVLFLVGIIMGIFAPKSTNE